MNLSSRIRAYLRDRRAVTAIEFAVTLPVLVFLAFVLFEFVHYQLARVRADKAAYLIAATITQLTVREHPSGGTLAPYQTVRANELEAVLREAENLLSVTTRAGAKVNAVGFTYIDQLRNNLATPPQPYNAPAILWAKGQIFEANPQGSESTIAALGSAASWGANLRMQRAIFQDTDTLTAIANYGNFTCPENVVMVEVFFEYEPLFDFFAQVSLIESQTFVSRSFLRPRGGSIEALEGDANFDQPAASYIATKSLGELCR